MKWMFAIAGLVALAACGGRRRWWRTPPAPTSARAILCSLAFDGDGFLYCRRPNRSDSDSQAEPVAPQHGVLQHRRHRRRDRRQRDRHANNDGSYTLTVNPLATLAAGSHRGNFTVTVCSDDCKSQLRLPIKVPFDFEVAAVPAPVMLSPSALTGSFVAGDAFPFRLNTLATPIQGAPTIHTLHGR